jgi:hypothetical protein
MLMIQIAGGILLAVLILAFLPRIIAAVLSVFFLVLLLAVMGVFFWGIWAGIHYMEARDIAFYFILFGVLSIVGGIKENIEWRRAEKVERSADDGDP